MNVSFKSRPTLLLGRSRIGAVALVGALVAALLPLSGSVADARPAPFVTGGGWVDVPVGGLVGQAGATTLNAGFVARPTEDGARGRTTANVRRGGPTLRAGTVTSLAVEGAVARWGGRASLDGRRVTFEATGVDGDLVGGEPDRFRIRVLGPDGTVLLDSEPGAAPGAVPTAVIDGQVVIHGGDVSEPPPPADQPPTADAGADRPVVLGDTVVLDGTASSDPDGDELAYAWTVLAAPDGATAVLADPMTATPSLTPDEVGAWELELTVEAGGLTDTDTVTLTVESAPNTPPTAVDDEASTDEDLPVTIDVLANDADADGDPLVLSSVGGASRGTTEVVAGEVRYTPLPDTSGVDSFVYDVTDGTATSSATVTVVVEPVNDPPAADAGADRQASVGSRVELDGTASSDVDGDALSYAWSILRAPVDATATLDAADTATPTLVPDVAGTWELELVVSDGSLSDRDVVLVEVVAAPNTAPTASDDAATTDEDVAVIVDVLANDSDDEGGTLSVATFDPVASDGGTVGLAADGRLVFTPAADANGTASFGYTVTDGELTDSATVVVTVVPVNDPPVASDDTAVTDEDVPVTVDVLGDDVDVDGDALTVVAVSDPADGTAAVLADGSVRYTPDPDTNGMDALTYTVSDGALTDTATLFVSVVAVADPPVAEAGPDLTVELGAAARLDGTASSDPDGDPLSYSWTVLSAPAGAGAQLVGADSATPTLTPDVAGTWELELVVDDGVDDTPTASDRVLVEATAPTGIALTIRDPLVGVERTTPATVTLPQAAPAGGTTVDLGVSDPSVVQLGTPTVTVPAGAESATLDLTGLATGTVTVTAAAAGLGSASAALTVTAQELTILEPIEIGPDELTSIPVQLAQRANTDVTVTFTIVDPSVALLVEDGARVPSTQVTIPAGQQLPDAATSIVGVALGTTEVVVSAPGVAPDRRDVVVALRGSIDPTNVTQPVGFVTTVTASISAPAPSGGLVIALSSDEDVAAFPDSVTIPAGELSTSFDITGTNVGNGVVDLAGLGFDGLGVTVTTTDPPTVDLGIPTSSSYRVGTGLQVRTGASLSVAPPTPTDVTITSSDPGITLSREPGTTGTATLVIPDVTSTSFLGFYVQGSGTPGTTATIEVSAPLYVGDARDAELLPSTLRLSSVPPISVDEAPRTVIASAAAILEPAFCSEFSCTSRLRQQPLLPGTIDVTLTSSEPSVLALVADDGSRVGSVTELLSGGTRFQEFVAFSVDGLAPGLVELELATPPGFASTAAERQFVEVTQPELRLNRGSSRPVALGQGLQTTMQVGLSAVPAGPVDVTLTVPEGSGITLASTPGVGGSTSLVVPGIDDITPATFWVQDRSGGAVGSRVTVTASATGFTSDAEELERRPKAVVLQGGLDGLGLARDVGQAVSGTIELAALSTAPESFAFRRNRPLDPLDDGYLVPDQAVGPDGSLDVSITSTDPAVATLTATGVSRTLPTTLSLSPGTASVGAALVPEQLGTTVVAIEQPTGFTTPGEFFSNEDFDAFTLEVRGKQLFDITPRDRVVGRDLRAFLTETTLVDQPVTVTVADPSVASLSLADGSSETSSITYPAGERPLLQVNGLTDGSTVLQYRADGYTPVDVAVTVVDPTVYFSASDGTTAVDEVIELYADDVEVDVLTGVQLPGTTFLQAQGLRPGAAPVLVGVTSDRPTVLTTVPEQVEIGPGGSARGSTLLAPQRIDFAELSLVAPTGWVLPTTSEDLLQVRVDAPSASLEGNRSALAVDGQDAFEVVTAYGPPEATDRTVRSSAPSVAVVSADPATAGASSITVPLAIGQTTATYHVQALAPGTTQITVESGNAYPDVSFDVEVLPATVRWNRSTYDTGFPTTLVLGLAGVRSDGSTTASGDTLRPGVSVTVQLTSSDPAVATAEPSVTLDAGNGGRVLGTDLLTFGAAGSTTVAITQPERTGYVDPPTNGSLEVTVR